MFTVPTQSRAFMAQSRAFAQPAQPMHTGWCGRCHDRRTFSGVVRTTSGGLLRARGRCTTCNTSVNVILGIAPAVTR
jgi:hypothetical protein